MRWRLGRARTVPKVIVTATLSPIGPKMRIMSACALTKARYCKLPKLNTTPAP
jgi:hypothetical protein